MICSHNSIRVFLPTHYKIYNLAFFYDLRVIFEEEKDINVIVTVYKAKSERYEI